MEDSVHSNHIESIAQKWRKSAPSILSSSHCEFIGTHLCTHARKTIPLASIYSFSTFIVSRIIDSKLVEILFTNSSYVAYKVAFCHQQHFTHSSFFLVSFIFIAHLFCGFAGACVNPGSIFSNSLFVHSLVYQITHSFLNGFQPTSISTSSMYTLPVILFSA